MSVYFSRVAAQFAHRLWRPAIVAAITILICAALNRSEAGGTLRVGYNDFPPYVFTDEHGSPSGMAVEVVRGAAALNHIRLEWVPVDDAEKALRSGQIDLFPLLTVTSPRKAAWYSSVPWWEASLSLVSLREHPLKDAAGAAGRRIAIRDSSYGAPVAAGILPGATLIPTRGAHAMIGALCGGHFDGVLLDARLIFDALLSPPAACTDQKLLLVPMPQASSRLATFARAGARSTASRLYAGIEQLAMDGTMTAIANRWFALPQQRYVRERLAMRQEARLSILFAAGVLLLAGFTFWHWRRTLGIRRIARQAWKRAVEAERRFETFMAHTPAISYMKEPSGRIVYVNDAFVRFHGVSSKDAIGQLDKDLFGESSGTIRDRDNEVLVSGRPLQYVLPQRGRDGEIYHWLVLKFLVTGEACEPRIGVVAVDITEQQRAADLVASSEERYRMLFEEAPVAIHEIDREGLVTRINRAGRTLCGYDEEEIIGRPAWKFVAPQLHEESRAAIRAKINGTRRLAPFERHYQRKDGQLLRVEVHETAIFGTDGSIQGLRSCLVNLTELYQAQERLDAYALQLQQNNAALAQALESAHEATRLKGQFLANMSHEIRTPMNGVLGMAELLLQSGLTEAQHSLARSVSQSGEHLLAIINDILDFSKVESGKLVLETVAFDLTATVEAAIELMAPAAQTKGLELTYWIAPELPPVRHG